MNKGICSTLLAVLACSASPCFAQGNPVPSASVQLSKVMVDTESNELKGKVKGGTLCVFPQKLKPLKEKKSGNYERYDLLFSGEMKGLGFNVVTTSADLFADDSDKNKGDFLIGAVVRPDTLNLCSSVNGEKGDLTLAVDWQIYDRATQQVVDTLTTTGHGAQDKFARDGLVQMWNAAFVENLKALVAQGVIQKHTGNPHPQAVSATVPATDGAS